jgi:ABC-2 type transport system permease protein
MTATTFAPTPTAPIAVELPPSIPFSSLLRIEWRKSVDTRAAKWLLLITGLLSVGIMAIPLIRTNDIDQSVGGYLTMAAFGAAMLLPIVSILTLTTEWTQRTVLATFTAEPRRGRVLGAKVGAATILALAGTVLAYVLTLGALALSSALGRDVSWTLQVNHIIGVAVFMLLNVGMAVAFGALIQNTAAAIVAYFALPTVVAMLGLLVKSAKDWFDSSTTFNWVLEGDWAGHTGQVLTTTAIWVAIPLAAGVVRTIRREVK